MTQRHRRDSVALGPKNGRLSPLLCSFGGTRILVAAGLCHSDSFRENGDPSLPAGFHRSPGMAIRNDVTILTGQFSAWQGIGGALLRVGAKTDVHPVGGFSASKWPRMTRSTSGMRISQSVSGALPT